MMLVDKLGAGSLARFQSETTNRQFIKWVQYFKGKEAAKIEKVEKWEHYFAKLYCLVKSAVSDKNSPPPKHDDELIKFTCNVNGKKKEAVKVTKEERVKEAKGFWSAFFAVNKVMSKAKK